MVGNDIVDLRDRDSDPATLHPRFDERVFAPHERPPRGKVYVILQREARYRGMLRTAGYCWGALDVMTAARTLWDAPICRFG